MPLLKVLFLLRVYDSKRERRIDHWSQSLVRATPATTGYVANISERAFTQGTFFVASIGQ
jgi:hypothetical protein